MKSTELLYTEVLGIPAMTFLCLDLSSSLGDNRESRSELSVSSQYGQFGAGYWNLPQVPCQYFLLTQKIFH